MIIHWLQHQYIILRMCIYNDIALFVSYIESQRDVGYVMWLFLQRKKMWFVYMWTVT